MKFCHFHKWNFVDLSDQFRLDIQSDKVVGAQSVLLKYPEKEIIIIKIKQKLKPKTK